MRFTTIIDKTLMEMEFSPLMDQLQLQSIGKKQKIDWKKHFLRRGTHGVVCF